MQPLQDFPETPLVESQGLGDGLWFHKSNQGRVGRCTSVHFSNECGSSARKEFKIGRIDIRIMEVFAMLGHCCKITWKFFVHNSPPKLSKLAGNP